MRYTLDLARRLATHSIPVAMMLAASTGGPFAHPAAATDSQAFYCIEDVDNPPIQSFTVPSGISQLQLNVQAAHGSTPGLGESGGFGGAVSAVFSVSPDGPIKPGQTLDVWVGCYDEEPVGFGYGGSKGVAQSALAGDGGYGGGGSAVIDPVTQLPLLVAGGGGGGGGAGSKGAAGAGGNGGPNPQPGQPKQRWRWMCQLPGSGQCQRPRRWGRERADNAVAAAVAAAIPAVAVARVETSLTGAVGAVPELHSWMRQPNLSPIPRASWRRTAWSRFSGEGRLEMATRMGFRTLRPVSAEQAD